MQAEKSHHHTISQPLVLPFCFYRVQSTNSLSVFALLCFALVILVCCFSSCLVGCLFCGRPLSLDLLGRAVSHCEESTPSVLSTYYLPTPCCKQKKRVSHTRQVDSRSYQNIILLRVRLAEYFRVWRLTGLAETSHHALRSLLLQFFSSFAHPGRSREPPEEGTSCAASWLLISRYSLSFFFSFFFSFLFFFSFFFSSLLFVFSSFSTFSHSFLPVWISRSGHYHGHLPTPILTSFSRSTANPCENVDRPLRRLLLHSLSVRLPRPSPLLPRGSLIPLRRKTSLSLTMEKLNSEDGHLFIKVRAIPLSCLAFAICPGQVRSPC